MHVVPFLRAILAMMFSMTHQLCWLLACFAITAGCAPVTPRSSATPVAKLTDVYWRLTEVDGGSVPPTTAGGREAHIRLLAEGHRVTGFSTCNNVFGRYEAPGANRLRFPQLGSTKMACVDAALTRREQRLMAGLQNADRYAIVDDTLTLFANDTPVARFTAVQGR